MLVEKHGAIVALDPSNGEILVLATGWTLILISLRVMRNPKPLSFG